MSAERNLNSFVEKKNPMFVYPSDGPRSLDLKIRLLGSSNYRLWKRAMVIALPKKRKLSFVHEP